MNRNHFLLILLLLIVSCQDFQLPEIGNKNSGSTLAFFSPEEEENPNNSGNVSASFQVVRESIQQKCLTCHAGSGSGFATGWGHPVTEEDFYSMANIVPGSIGHSQFHQRMLVDMPPAGALQMTSNEHQLVSEWIEGLGVHEIFPIEIRSPLNLTTTNSSQVNIVGACQTGRQYLVTGDVIGSPQVECDMTPNQLSPLRGSFQVSVNLINLPGTRTIRVHQNHNTQNSSAVISLFYNPSVPDTTPPAISLNVLNLVGNQTSTSQVVIQGICETGLPVSVTHNGNLLGNSASCLDPNNTPVGSYSMSIPLSTFGNHTVAAAQTDLAGNVGQANTNFNRAMVIQNCHQGQEFQDFKQALTEATCYHCHGDNQSELYNDFRALDNCEENWSSSSYVSAGAPSQSSVYNKMVGSGLTFAGSPMPPFHSALSTTATYNSVVAEMSSFNSTIRGRTQAWINSLDNATLSNLTWQRIGNVILFSVDKDWKSTREVRFLVYNQANVLVQTFVAASSPYQASFIPPANGQYQVRAQAIEFNYNENNPTVGISSTLQQNFTVNFISSQTGPPSSLQLTPGLSAKYFSDLTFQNQLTVNSGGIIPMINMNFANGPIHPEHPSIVDNFSIEIDGFIEIPQGQGGDYIFTAEVDDVLNLEINGVTLIDMQNGGNHTISSNPLNLSSGIYPFKARYSEHVFGANFRLFWQLSQIGTRELIPASAFSYSPALINGLLSIQSPAEGTRFSQSVPFFNGQCIGGFDVVVSGAIALAQTVPCDENNNTFSISNLELSAGDGPKPISISQQIFGFNFVDEVTVYRDITPPHLVFIQTAAENSSIPNGIVVRGLCEVGAGPVQLSGDTNPQSTNCNNEFSFIVSFNAGQGPVSLQVRQSDSLGNEGVISRSFNLLAGSNQLQVDPQVPDFTNSCQVSGVENESASGMRTLTRTQLINSFDDLLGTLSFYNGYLQSGAGILGLGLIEDSKPLETLTSIDHFTRSVHEYSQSSKLGLSRFVLGLAGHIEQDQARAREFLGASCYNNPNNSCLNTFLDSFLRRAFRRPPTSAQVNQRITLFNNSANSSIGVQNIIVSTLLAPEFTYRLRLGNAQGGFINFDNHTIIEEISYRYRNKMPDAYLISIGNESVAFTEARVNQIINELFENPNYQEDIESVIWNFFKEWLHLVYGQALGTTPMAQVKTNGMIPNSSTAISLYDAMIDEAKNYVLHIIRSNGSYQDFFTGQNSFLENGQLANYYGIPAWNGQTNNIPVDPTRFGFFTLPASLVARGLGYVNPFSRGGGIYKQVFCGSFVSANVNPTTPVFDRTELRTNRQFFDDLIPDGSSCMNCHTAINAHGFAFEDRDFLGKLKGPIEQLYDTAGNQVGQLQVDALSEAPLGNSTISVNGSNDLLNKAFQTQVPQACMSKRYFNYFYGRQPGSEDGCKVQSLFDLLRSSSSLKEFFKEAGKGQSLMKRKGS